MFTPRLQHLDLNSEARPFFQAERLNGSATNLAIQYTAQLVVFGAGPAQGFFEGVLFFRRRGYKGELQSFHLPFAAVQITCEKFQRHGGAPIEQKTKLCQARKKYDARSFRRTPESRTD